MSGLPVAASKSKPRGSTPLYVALADRIEARIACGELPEGSQLSPERELAKQNGVAYLTARQAVGVLVKKGVVSRRHGYGTFVKAGSRKSMIALICGPDLRNETNHFYRAMTRAVEKEGKDANWTFRLYDGLTDECGHRQPEESQLQRSLQADLLNYDFSGVIEIAPGREGLWHDGKNLPAPRSVFELGHPSSDLEFDNHDFGKTAVRHLLEREVSRIQILQFSPGAEGSSALLEGAFDSVAEAGNPQLKVRVADVRINRAEYEKSICDSTLELIRAWRQEPAIAPEGLIVTDDIAMRAVALALIQSGFGVEKVLPIVCQASEGIEHHYGVPVSRYEYQLGEAARTLIRHLSLRMEGKPLPKLPVMISGILRSNPR